MTLIETRPAPFRDQFEQREIDHFHRTVAGILEDRREQNHWRRWAACIDLPKELFFPERGDQETYAAARKVCAGCPVNAQCADATDGLSINVGGVWAGITIRQRKRKDRKAAGGDSG